MEDIRAGFLTGTFPVGVMFALYDEEGYLQEQPGIDVETGRFLSPVKMSNGWSLWIKMPDGGTWMPVVQLPCVI